MAITEILISPRFTGALLVYALASIANVLLMARLAEATHDVAVTHWLVTRMLIPLSRVALMVTFILIAYPALYGFVEAPGLGVIFTDSRRLHSLINWLFLLSLALPLLPVVGRMQAAVLPLQGIAAAALVLLWAFGEAVLRFFPAPLILALIVAAAVAGHALAMMLAALAGQYAYRRHHVLEFDTLAYEGFILILQAPAILIYSVWLGSQIHA